MKFLNFRKSLQLAAAYLLLGTPVEVGASLAGCPNSADESETSVLPIILGFEQDYSWKLAETMKISVLHLDVNAETDYLVAGGYSELSAGQSIPKANRWWDGGYQILTMDTHGTRSGLLTFQDLKSRTRENFFVTLTGESQLQVSAVQWLHGYDDSGTIDTASFDAWAKQSNKEMMVSFVLEGQASSTKRIVILAVKPQTPDSFITELKSVDLVHTMNDSQKLAHPLAFGIEDNGFTLQIIFIQTNVANSKSWYSSLKVTTQSTALTQDKIEDQADATSTFRIHSVRVLHKTIKPSYFIMLGQFEPSASDVKPLALRFWSASTNQFSHYRYTANSLTDASGNTHAITHFQDVAYVANEQAEDLLVMLLAGQNTWGIDAAGFEQRKSEVAFVLDNVGTIPWAIGCDKTIVSSKSTCTVIAEKSGQHSVLYFIEMQIISASSAVDKFSLTGIKNLFKYNAAEGAGPTFEQTTALAIYTESQSKVLSFVGVLQTGYIGYNGAQGWQSNQLESNQAGSIIATDNTSWACPQAAGLEEQSQSETLDKITVPEGLETDASIVHEGLRSKWSAVTISAQSEEQKEVYWKKEEPGTSGTYRTYLSTLVEPWTGCKADADSQEMSALTETYIFDYNLQSELDKEFVVLADNAYSEENDKICLHRQGMFDDDNYAIFVSYDENFDTKIDLVQTFYDAEDTDDECASCDIEECKKVNTNVPDGLCNFYGNYGLKYMFDLQIEAKYSQLTTIKRKYSEINSQYEGLFMKHKFDVYALDSSLEKTFTIKFTSQSPQPVVDDQEQQADDVQEPQQEAVEPQQEVVQPTQEVVQPAQEVQQDAVQVVADEKKQPLKTCRIDSRGKTECNYSCFDKDNKYICGDDKCYDDQGFDICTCYDIDDNVIDCDDPCYDEDGSNICTCYDIDDNVIDCNDPCYDEFGFDICTCYDIYDFVIDCDDPCFDEDGFDICTCFDIYDFVIDCDDPCYDVDGFYTCDEDDTFGLCTDIDGFYYYCDDPCYDDSGIFTCFDDFCLDDDGNDICTNTEQNVNEELVSLFANQASSAEDIASAILKTFDSTSEKALDKALGLVLQVKDAEKVAAEQEKVLDITDTTDLKKEAYFDINAFIKSRGLIDTRGLIESSESTAAIPDFVLQNSLTEVFTVPQSAVMSDSGQAILKFGSTYTPQAIDEMITSLKNSNSTTTQSESASDGLRLLESLQTSGNGTAVAELESQISMLFPISQILKVSKSVKCTLIPGDDSFPDKKGFKWELFIYEKTKLGLRFSFAHPEYISVGETDTMKVEFNNTQVYVPSGTNNMMTMPDGYTITMTVPPQGTGLLSQEEVKNAKDNAQAFMIGNLIMSLLLKQTMAILLGSIVVIQILAHLPLADIYLPANAHQQFDIMISFVSFDYFAPSEYIDFGFSEMPSWSDRFEWLGYDNINFVEGMGSIIIFAAISLLQILLSLIFVCIRRLTKKNWLQNKLQFNQSLGEGLTFVHGTFFEILVCVSISMKMIEFSDFLNSSDWVSLSLSFFFGALLLSYIVFLLYFSFTKSSKLVTKERASKEENQKELKRSIQKTVLYRSSKKNPERVQEIRAVLKESRRKNSTLIENAKEIDEKQFEKFQPIVSDLRTDSHVAMFSNTFISVRRMMLLYMAMFILGHQWLQVLTFMSMNVLSMVFLLVAMPFESKLMNYLSLFNEGLAVIISYFIAQINDLKYTPETMVIIGDCIVYSIYFSWIVNGFIILYVSVSEVYQNLRRYYLTKLRWKYEYLHPKIKKIKEKKLQGVKKAQLADRWSDKVKSAKELPKQNESEVAIHKEKLRTISEEEDGDHQNFDPFTRQKMKTSELLISATPQAARIDSIGLFDYQKDGVSNTNIRQESENKADFQIKQLAREQRLREIKSQAYKAEEVNCIVSSEDGSESEEELPSRRFHQKYNEFWSPQEDDKGDIKVNVKINIDPEQILARIYSVYQNQLRSGAQRMVQEDTNNLAMADTAQSGRLFRTETDSLQPRYLPYGPLPSLPLREERDPLNARSLAENQRVDSGNGEEPTSSNSSPSRNIVLNINRKTNQQAT